MLSVPLHKLLSSCIDASQRGCQIIRDFQSGDGYNNSNKLKEVGEIKSVVTQADIDAQHCIISGLRERWGPSLRIIGEEDETPAKSTVDVADLPRLRDDILSNDLGISTDEEIPLDEVTIFVDPLDGTREFVEGRLENVACLIGIVRNDRSIGGVIGLPFPSFSKDNDAVISRYAISTDSESVSGTWPEAVVEVQTSDSSSSASTSDAYAHITVLTGDSKDPVLQNATACALSIASDLVSSPPPEHKLVGGTAAKLQLVASTPNSVAVLHFKTELWDTCAPSALIHAQGGKITDLFGSPLVHTPRRSTRMGNVFGVVASSGVGEAARVHDLLCAKMRADPKSVEKVLGKCMSEGVALIDGAQAVDVSRDLDGEPLDRSWVEKQVLLNAVGRDGAATVANTASLTSYSVPESGAWRGLMSTGCRLELEWEGCDSDGRELPSTVFYKRVVMSNLSHARDKLTSAPHKISRDVKSYQVETAFLTSKACQNGLIEAAGLRICRLLGSDLRPVTGGPREAIQSRFAVLLEDFCDRDGWTQQWLLDKSAAKAALKTFATMHGYFWTGSNFWKQRKEDGAELEDAVWCNGGYMQPQLQGWDQLNLVDEGFRKRLPSFEDDLKLIPELDGVKLETIGERLQMLAKEVGVNAHPFYEKGAKPELEKYRTLIHGDPKQANIFLHNGDGSVNVEPEVGLIDFQWSGFGLAATDLAHHISAAVTPDCVSYDGSKEAELIDYYYACLSEALVKFGVASSISEVEDHIFPRRVLQEQYEIALLDICRMVFAYAWRRWKPESEPTAASLNRNAYNKSLPSALWLITRCSALLEAREK